ncbi:hypothetical protein RvY_13691 [Ramazzottius varieornatus]|uniref:Uncharacterized protein n=1 Tax=Ramazzottius varieornatus TaxID=947166 RepID=A0A1D1VXA2_RAMVA|nr:hypothetical protein RvY_13691 [Ramazzottius varieornatus]
MSVRAQRSDSTFIIISSPSKSRAQRYSEYSSSGLTKPSSASKQPIFDQVVRKRSRTTIATVMKIVPSSALIRRAKAARPVAELENELIDTGGVEVTVLEIHPEKENCQSSRLEMSSRKQIAKRRSGRLPPPTVDQPVETSSRSTTSVESVAGYIQKKKMEIEQLKAIRDGRLKDKARLVRDVNIGQSQYQIVCGIHAHHKDEWAQEDSEGLLVCRLRKVLELQKEVGRLREDVDRGLDRLISVITEHLDTEECSIAEDLQETPLKMENEGSTDLKQFFRDLVGRYMAGQSFLYAAKYHPSLTNMLACIGLISFDENSPERIALAFERS